jgi:8-oxo-dGTP diphosphatase
MQYAYILYADKQSGGAMTTAQGNRKDEQSYLDGYDASSFDRPSVTIDVAMLTIMKGELRVLVVRRNENPFEGDWALPGGFVRMDESLEEAAERVLQEKVGLENIYLEQLYTFGHPERDPRMRVITVSYYALIAEDRLSTAELDQNTQLAQVVVLWEGERGGPVNLFGTNGELPLAFDHAEIIGMAVKRIRGKLDYVPIGFQLLPERFTLRQLQEIHEVILDRDLNKDSFRRRLSSSGLIKSTGERERQVDHRPATLYRFTKRSAI